MAVHSPVNGMTAIPWRGSRRRQSLVSVLEKLRGCQDAWCPGAPWDREGAHAALWGRPAGSFLLLKDAETSQPSLLCVSTGRETEEVVDYPMKCTGTVFQLSDSHLSFSDLAQLVLFYSFTRDVLSVCLSIPPWIYSVTEQTKARLSQLGPKAWLCAPTDLQTEHITQNVPSTLMCSIQLTSANGALCVINPLYLREHGDDWLTHQPATYFKRERRLSTTRPWGGAGLVSKRALSLDQEHSAASAESSGLIRAQSADNSQCTPTPPTPTPPEGVVLRRPSRDSTSVFPRRAESLSSPTPPATPSTCGASPCSLFEQQQPHGSSVPQSPHRVSWIEDGVWLAPPRPPSLLHPPSLELDSLSISSIEEEQESQVSSPSPYQPSAHRLADKVIHRISVVGQVIGGLVCQQKRLTNRVLELSERKSGTFTEALKGFVETTLNLGIDPNGATGSEYLQEVRSLLTTLRETLLDCTEIQTLLDSMTDTSDQDIDSMVERSLHKVALKPIYSHLYSSLQISRCNDGSQKHLQDNQRVLEGRSVDDLGGSAGAGVPDPPTLERIQQRWIKMHTAYSPSKKVEFLLKNSKTIYHSMSANAKPGVVFGADDFLPCLTWVLLRSNVVTLQLDTDYMMELLDPMQLQGEGGYYLTSLYASLYYISSFQPRLAVRQLSVEAQQSISQWHRRRTLHCNQSRRSKHRRTIRRHANRERGEKNPETETGSQQEDESDSIEVANSKKQTRCSSEAVEPVRGEVGRGQEAENQSNLSAPASQQEMILGKEKNDRLSGCAAGEEDHGET
ncbi:ras and Rab interactor 2 [Myripristis murdjan]|uniref:ras and Rab interactor 2 n=1 Tax=Myripristis murdjan TaxID=586833 RepID=UPI001175F334|nr:ras and Rab interactor 2-like [Myripristis murdjan]